MEDMNTGAEGQDASMDTSAGNDVAQDGVQDTNTGAEPNGGAVEGGENSSTEAAQDEMIVEQDGEQFIPYERFKQINERLKAAEEKANFLDAIKTDPAKRQELAEALGLDPKNPANAQPNDKPQPAPFQKWLSESVDPQYHGHYSGMVQSIASELEEYVNGLVAPLQQALGAMKLKEVESKIPDFGQHEKAVADMMHKHPSLSVEQAYQLVTYDKRFQNGQAAGIKKAVTQQQKIGKTPVTKSPGGAAVTKAEPPKNLADAMNRAWNKINGPAQ
jgi:prophage antirepressor-like protein